MEAMNFEKNLPFGEEFENRIAAYFRGKGWKVTKVDEANRQYYDMMIERNGIKVAIECKRMQTKYKKCKDHLGYDGDTNLQLNLNAYNHYMHFRKETGIPHYLVVLIEWTDTIYYGKIEDYNIANTYMVPDQEGKVNNVKVNGNIGSWKTLKI